MLRGAIVGLGGVSFHTHVPGWLKRPDVDIVAASDADPARRAAAEARLPGVAWYDSAAELMERERLDFVDLCTPPSSHAELIHAALDHDLHVLCEKPLVCSVADLAAVMRVASTVNRVMHTVHNWHHAPIIRRARELVREGAIGRIQRVVWHTLRTRPAGERDGVDNWRVDPKVAGGGVLTDHGWHVFYVLQRWFGARPTSISATLETRSYRQFPVEDTATVRLTYPDATAEVLLTWASDVRRNWAELTGSDGTITLEDDTLVLARRRRGSVVRRWRCPPALSDGSHHPDWFHDVIDDFLTAVRESMPVTANLMEASLCVVLEELARESSRRAGQALSLTVPLRTAPAAVAGLLR